MHYWEKRLHAATKGTLISWKTCPSSIWHLLTAIPKRLFSGRHCKRLGSFSYRILISVHLSRNAWTCKVFYVKFRLEKCDVLKAYE